MALDQYFEKQEIAILEKLYKSMNSLDISLMPLLSYNEKIILRASDDPMLFNENFLEMEAFAKSMKKYNSKSNSSHIKKIDRHFFETNVLYDIGAKNPIKVPIKIPMTMINGEVGDVSCFILLLLLFFFYSYILIILEMIIIKPFYIYIYILLLYTL